MSRLAGYVVAVVLSYLLGAIPWGYLIGRLKGVDIRTVGSGNIGATNVFRSIGKGWGILTFAMDFLKGFASVFLFSHLVRSPAGAPSAVAPMLCAAAAIAGHNWPVYLRFRGGKGIATSAGALLGLAPLSLAIGLLAWAFVFFGTRYVSVASIVSAGVIAGATWMIYAPAEWLRPAALTLLAAVAIWRHKSNIQRLIRGTEHRFEFKKSRF
jgi:glycerol-3-phosphate acyltransferase PlsY